MFACSLSANPADHVNGYGLRSPSLRQVGMKRFSLPLERTTIVRVDGGLAVEWVAIRILMPLQARDCVLRGGGG